jgi:C-terminal processing protease CtpA/Prc
MLGDGEIGASFETKADHRGVRIADLTDGGELSRGGARRNDVIVKVQNAVVLGWTPAEVESVLSVGNGKLSITVAPALDVRRCVADSNARLQAEMMYNEAHETPEVTWGNLAPPVLDANPY